MFIFYIIKYSVNLTDISHINKEVETIPAEVRELGRQLLIVIIF